jgi:predicted small integral membrane protein
VTWGPETRWFDVALVTSLFAVGNILFGRFVEHQPRWRRLLKLVLVAVLFVGLSAAVGRGWALGVLAIPLVGAAYVHLAWLPKHGVDGWTGEPRERYLELMRASTRRGPAGSD